MPSAFNLLFFLILCSHRFLYESAMCSGEIALKNNHYYYYYLRCNTNNLLNNFNKNGNNKICKSLKVTNCNLHFVFLYVLFPVSMACSVMFFEGHFH